jgi:hypothetical protein
MVRWPILIAAPQQLDQRRLIGTQFAGLIDADLDAAG